MKTSRIPPTTPEDLVLIADLRMDGVRFARLANNPRSSFRGLEGSLSLCYLGRAPALWVEIAPTDEPAYEIAFPPGSILSISGDLPHWFKPGPGRPTAKAAPATLAPIPRPGGDLDLLVGFIPNEMMANTSLILREMVVAPAPDDPTWRRIVRAFDAIEDELCAPDPLGAIDAEVRRQAEVILLNFARLAVARSNPVDAFGISAIREPRIHRVLAAVSRDLAFDWTLDSLSHVAGMSRTAFVELFREVIGATPMRSVTTLRLAEAARVLASTTANLEEVANRVGYASSEGFVRAFERSYGMPPGRWRRGREEAVSLRAGDRLTQGGEPPPVGGMSGQDLGRQPALAPRRHPLP